MKIEDVTAFFGSKSKLAEALGVSPSAATQWRDNIPVGRQYQIQVITNGKFKAAEHSQEKKQEQPIA